MRARVVQAAEGAIPAGRCQADGMRRDEPRPDRWTYPEVGATRGALPPGYRHLHLRGVVGHGEADLARAADVVLGWAMHRGAGVEVTTDADRAAPGVTLAVSIGVGPVRVRARSRVVYVIEEARRRGFAYGTLPGHPLSGEEVFRLQRCPDDAVRLTVDAFARPALWWSRLGWPLVVLGQLVLARRYVRAVRRAVR